uniref:Uncharacterized protein n=1 Tax=Strix occidentalis caurina TaxID=311401 RepID=A0A8D0FPH8_STROC
RPGEAGDGTFAIHLQAAPGTPNPEAPATRAAPHAEPKWRQAPPSAWGTAPLPRLVVSTAEHSSSKFSPKQPWECKSVGGGVQLMPGVPKAGGAGTGLLATPARSAGTVTSPGRRRQAGAGAGEQHTREKETETHHRVDKERRKETMCAGDGNNERRGRKQKERKRDQISQTDGEPSIWTTLPAGPGARLHPGVLAPTRPNPTAPTQSEPWPGWHHLAKTGSSKARSDQKCLCWAAGAIQRGQTP